MSVAIWWIRRDLRLADNPALMAALQHGRVIPLYIHAPQEEGAAAPGGGSRWWLHHSLMALGQALSSLGLRLMVRHGQAALPVLQEVLRTHQADAVFWNRQYGPMHIARDARVKAELRQAGVRAESFNGGLLFEPWQIPGGKDHPYRVFTPYWKACLQAGVEQAVLPAPSPGTLAGEVRGWEAEVAALGLLPTAPDWAQGLRATWTPGEQGAWQRLTVFIAQALAGYRENRNRPGYEGTSRLSPHLHFGEISPRQIVRAVMQARAGVLDDDAQHFLSELGWREFNHHLLYHFPHSVDQPLNERWQSFPWAASDPELWRAWRKGQTGIPLVDAGMRELWQTGWMHNRVRMNAASLLVKNMLIPWQQGERWFWDTLVDADLANNVQGWQWTAGCGADAAPYFRIFNPVLQGERFDPQGVYVRRWVPELARLPDAWVHKPWEAPAQVRAQAGLTLGVHYPWPVVDLAATRQRALKAYEAVKGH